MKRKILFPALILVVQAASAGTYNSRTNLVGERAVGLGGAYTAISDTAEGGYYNPAGLAFIDNTTLSLTANLYRVTRGNRAQALKFAGSQADLSQNSFSSIPVVANFARRFPEGSANAFGLNIIVTDQIDLFGRVDFDVANGTALLTRSIQDRTLLIGPSYARKINDRLSVGISVFYSLRQVENMAFIYEDDPATLGQGFLLDVRSIGNFVAKLGGRYSPFENFWIGLTYQPPSIRLHSDASRFSSTIAQNKTTAVLDKTLLDQQNLVPEDPIPQTATLGLAYLKKGVYLVAADVAVSPKNDFSAFSNVAGGEVNRETVANFSIGGEYYVRPNVPVRLGFFSDYSSAPGVIDGVGGQADHVDFLGFSLSGSLDTEKTSVTLGTTMSFGRGEGIDNLKNRIDVSENNYGILLAGSYKF
jgi:hypothetical protein